MKLKPLIITVIVLAACSVAAHFLTRSSGSPSADPRVGQPVMDRSMLEQAAQLRLTGEGTTVLLVKQPDASWQVDSYYNLPVDFERLSRLADDLTNSRIQRFVTASPERLARLEFTDRKITLLDASGHELWSLAAGKNADGGGFFVSFGAEQKAYLARPDVWFDTVAKNWADTTLLNLKASDIAKIEIGFETAPTLVVSCARPSDPFTAATTPPGQQLATDKIYALLGQFTNLRFSDTTDLTDPNAVAARQHSRTLKFTTFDGRTYRIALGRRPAATEQVTKSEISNLKSQINQPAGPVYAFITCSNPSAPVNALMQKRACQIYDYSYTSLPEKPGDLFGPAPPPAQAVAPTAKSSAKS
jgi:hypothetical protein